MNRKNSQLATKSVSQAQGRNPSIVNSLSNGNIPLKVSGKALCKGSTILKAGGVTLTSSYVPRNG